MRKGTLFLLLFLQACTSNGVRPLKPLELAVGPYRDRPAAAMTGSLMYEGGCLLFREDKSAAHLLPVWPNGSVFNGTSVIFHQPGKSDQRVVVGEEFLMEGESAGWDTLPATYAPFSHQCRASPFFVSRVRPAN